MAGSQRFVIEAPEAERMARESGVSVVQLLPSLVGSAQAMARAPISNYSVGAVGLASDGRIFMGVNLEFPGLPLNQSVHAEQFLLTNASLNAASRIDYIAVSAAPCGHCRQFFQEMRGAPEMKILVAEDNQEEEKAEFRPLSYFLPKRFGPHDLLPDNVPLLLEPHCNGLSLGSRSNGRSEGFWDDLSLAALEAANLAHAPYSGCPSGVALLDSEGRVFVGSYVESAAYNPSLAPLQAALVAYVAGAGREYGAILAGALVEKEGAVVGQENIAQMLLLSIAPRCDFRVFHCFYLESDANKSNK